MPVGEVNLTSYGKFLAVSLTIDSPFFLSRSLRLIHLNSSPIPFRCLCIYRKNINIVQSNSCSVAYIERLTVGPKNSSNRHSTNVTTY